MSGHSKWATIKRVKEVNDAKRGNIFTKLANNITIAAREGGGDITSNFKLRLAMEKAKQANMPKDNIDRAIKRGTGELKGESIEEVMYGGFLPGQYVAVIKCLTDNKNRALAEIKTAFQKNGGQVIDFNSVAWQFENKGLIKIQHVVGFGLKDESTKKSDGTEEIIIESGAEDYEPDEEGWIIYTKPQELQKVKEKLEGSGLEIESADLAMVAKESKDLSDEYAEKVEKALEALDDLDDVQDYYTNIK